MTETRFVIAVNEQREAALVGCAGQSYTSPPQTLEQARALAGLLLGGPVAGAGPWRQAIAGGQRTVALIAEAGGDGGLGDRSPQGFGAVDWPRPENPRKGSRVVNRYQCTGRLVEDPVLRHTTTGKDVCEMRLAVDGMAPGNETGFLNVAQFGAGGVAAADTLTKGWLVAFDGRLEHHTWKDRESGQSRHAYVAVGNVEFLTAPRSHSERTMERATEADVAVESDQEAANAPRAQQTPPQTRPAVGAAVGGAVSDEIEF